MRKALIAGNWKMHGSKASVETLLDGLQRHCYDLPSVDWLVCPPAVFLPLCAKRLAGYPVALGGQNVADRAEGACTGEISAAMLREYGAGYAILGHSERRHQYGESRELIAARLQAAIVGGLQPILCVGETLAEREAGRAKSVVEQQLQSAWGNHDAQKLSSLVIAYEPVWAIGTGRSATPEQAQEMHAFIRDCLLKVDAHLAQSVRILYGGSVKPDNAKAILMMDDIDGALIGGASLDAQSFSQIGRLCNS
jgi:triosephosphate isomerase